MFNGTLTENAIGFTLDLASMSFDINGLQVTPNTYKKADNHPDYQIEVRTPRGRMMRVGAMWKAKSERTGNEYFSISLTDRRGKTWRMNAVRTEDMVAGEWSIRPLAGGDFERIMLSGELERTDDGAMAGIIEGYDFSMNVIAVPSDTKTDDAHPDYHLEATSPAGTAIRVGALWEATSRTSGATYFSIAFWSPHGTQHRANAVKATDSETQFNIIPLAEQREEEGIAA